MLSTTSLFYTCKPLQKMVHVDQAMHELFEYWNIRLSRIYPWTDSFFFKIN